MQTRQEVQNMTNYLNEAFCKLCSNDKDLISLDDLNSKKIIHNKKLKRELHEVCINHRLAKYLEDLLPNYFNKKYCVDIEYNRCKLDKKWVAIDNEDNSVRPDIIIHTRAIEYEFPQHLLVIEAKKNRKFKKDTEKVKAFIKDDRYEYCFGLVLKYNRFNPIKGTLYYKNYYGAMQEKSIEYPS